MLYYHFVGDTRIA